MITTKPWTMSLSFLRLFGEHADMEAILKSFPMEMEIDDRERPESSTAAVPLRQPAK
jgi:hypothetical protein